jgi:hypothetical protein
MLLKVYRGMKERSKYLVFFIPLKEQYSMAYERIRKALGIKKKASISLFVKKLTMRELCGTIIAEIGTNSTNKA